MYQLRDMFVIFSLFTVVKNILHEHKLDKWLAKFVENCYSLILINDN